MKQIVNIFWLIISKFAVSQEQCYEQKSNSHDFGWLGKIS